MVAILSDCRHSYNLDFMVPYNPFSLEGKTILVVGASSGIGQSTAIECSKLGARLIIIGRNVERLNATLSLMDGNGHSSIACDITNSEQLASMVDTLPKLDGVVLSAGQSMTLPTVFSTRQKFDGVFDVNFFAPVELLRSLCKSKKLQSPSSAVFVTSIAGTRRWMPGNAIYGSSKAALDAMVHYFAIELGHKQIRVNAVCPGMVETPLIYSSGVITKEQMEADRKNYPLERYGQPADIAHAIIYLLSDASSWVTGHSLVVDGGITAK